MTRVLHYLLLNAHRLCYSVDVQTEYKNRDVWNLFSSVGGAVGLWVGLSVLGIGEFLLIIKDFVTQKL